MPRVYTITYYEPDDEKEGTVAFLQSALENGDLRIDDLNYLAKDKDSGITVTYAVHDE